MCVLVKINVLERYSISLKKPDFLVILKVVLSNSFLGFLKVIGCVSPIFCAVLVLEYFQRIIMFHSYCIISLSIIQVRQSHLTQVLGLHNRRSLGICYDQNVTKTNNLFPFYLLESTKKIV